MTIWQSLTLSNVSALSWVRNSYVLRVIGLVHSWRSQSFLMAWIEPLAVILISAVFALAPLVANSYTGFLLFACAVFWGLITISDSRGEMKVIPSHFLLLLYWFCAVLATAQSPVKSAAAHGLVKLSLYLGSFLLMDRLMRRAKWRNVLTTVYLFSALFVTVYGIRQLLFGAEALATWVDPTSSSADEIRVYSYLGNPNLLAGYILPAIPLGIGALLTWTGWLPKALAAVMTLLNLVCLYGTGSRGGWIGTALAIFVLGVLLLYWILPKLPKFWRASVFPIFISSIVGVIALGLLFSPSFRFRALSVFAGREDSSNNFRINVWTSVIHMIRDRPFLGIGPGNSAFNLIYPLYQRPNFSALGAYCIYLEMMVEVGLIGFSIFVWFLVTLLNRAWRVLQQLRSRSDATAIGLMSVIAAVVGMMAHGFVDTVWYRPEVATVWWFLIASLFSYAVQFKLPESEPDVT